MCRYVLLEWVGMLVERGVQVGTLRGGDGWEQSTLRHLTSLRAEFFSIGDYTAGRMPLAYVQVCC